MIKHVTDGQATHQFLSEVQDMNLIIPFKIHYFINIESKVVISEESEVYDDQVGIHIEIILVILYANTKETTTQNICLDNCFLRWLY